jgi:hypothetical protein
MSPIDRYSKLHFYSTYRSFLLSVMPQLLLFLVSGLYVYVGYRFWQGFYRTNFTGSKILLTLLWPVLTLANKSYRKNFQKALRGN